MTFWQGFVIQVMASLGMVNDKAALQIQNLLICIEMLIASVAHFYIFPYHEWQEGYKREKQKSTLIRDTLALQDFVRDMQVMTTPWETAPDPSASNGTIDSHAVTMCFEEAEGGKGVDVGVGDLDEGQDSGKSQAHTGRTASGDIRSERSERSERSSGDSLPEDLEGGESYFSYTSILFNQLDTQTDSRPAANMMHSLYSDSPLHAAPRPKSTGHSLSLSARPEHGYRALKGDDRDKGRDRDRDSLPIPEARRSTGGTGTGSISSSSGKGSGGDLAAALGSINRNMLQLNELGIDLGSNKSANSSNSANSFKNSNQADDEPPDASQIWLKGSGSTAVKTSLPPLWTWSAAASTAPHTESNLTGEDSGRGNSEGKAGEHEWRSVEGERGSIDGLSNSNSNSVSADDIFKPSPSTSSSPPVSSHNLDVTHGSSGFLAGASGPLNRIHSQATTALSPGTAASASSPVVHPRSFTPERNESNRGDDESDGDDCESCLHSVGTPDDSLDHHPNPDLPADLPIIPLSIPTPIPIPLSIRDTRSASLCESLSEDESPHVQPLGTDSSRSPEGVGVGSESRVDLGPAGISSRNQYDTLPLNQQSGGAAASSSHIPLKSYKALPGPFPVPAPVDRDGAVAAAMKGSVAVGSEGGERMLSRGNAPLSGLSNPHSNKDNSLVVDVIESGSKLESKRNTVAPSAAASASATPGKLVRNAQDEDDEDAEHVLPHPDSLALTHTEDFTAAHTAQGTGMEGDGTPPSLFGVEMLEEESV